jgi:hypothetical protein
MTQQRNETKYFKPVGIKDGSIYFLDYTFNNGDFKGATGTVFDPITQEEIDEYNDKNFVKDIYKDSWVESVKSGHTEESLDDFVEDIIDHCDGEYPHQDCSYSHLWDEAHKYFDDSVITFNCAGGGRCFDKELLNSFDKVIDPELIKIIKQYEDIKEAA